MILASASPQRLEVLRSLGVDVTVDPADLDEEAILGESAGRTALLRARAKALHVAGRHPGRWILGADTTVESPAGAVLGSPATTDEARVMLGGLLGTTHAVHSAAVLLRGGTRHEHLATARVTLKTATPEDLEAYLAGGEPLGKAGGLCVQGEGRRFVARLDGSEDVVIGLPTDWLRATVSSLE